MLLNSFNKNRYHFLLKINMEIQFLGKKSYYELNTNRQPSNMSLLLITRTDHT